MSPLRSPPVSPLQTLDLDPSLGYPCTAGPVEECTAAGVVEKEGAAAGSVEEVVDADGSAVDPDVPARQRGRRAAQRVGSGRFRSHARRRGPRAARARERAESGRSTVVQAASARALTGDGGGRRSTVVPATPTRSRARRRGLAREPKRAQGGAAH
jgi:hypothetical protein